LHDFQKLIALRHERRALRRGTFRFLWAKDQVIAIARQLGDETIVVVINAARDTRRLDLPLEGLVADQTALAECWAHDVVRVEGGILRDLALAPRSGRILATPTSG
jgi:cyclomaltodextrinase / maltogenic alpha-amylase / neopullulanase